MSTLTEKFTASQLAEIRAVGFCDCGCTTEGFTEDEVLDAQITTLWLGLPQPPCYAD
jgi:hypothetical protein